MITPQLPVTHVFLGFNLNIDSIISLNPEKSRIFMDVINMIQPELLEPLIKVIQKGKAREFIITEKLARELMNTFHEGKQILGGQEGFFLKNLMYHFYPQLIPVIHFPVRTVKLRSIISRELAPEYSMSEVKAFSSLGVISLEESFINIEETTRETVGYVFKQTPIHFVFEYPKEMKVTWNKQTIKTPLANRIIFSYDPINFTGAIDPWFLETFEKNISKQWISLVSGYHLWNVHKIPLERLKQHESILRILHTKTRWVHVELAYTSNQETREWIMNHVLPYAHSIGLNEVELELFSEATFLRDKKHLLKQYMKALTSFHEQVVFFHTHGLYLVYDPKKLLADERIKKAFQVTEEIIIFDRKTHDSRLKTLWEEKEVKACIQELNLEKHVRYYLPKVLEPISTTVGLGDTISSSIIFSLFS